MESAFRVAVQEEGHGINAVQEEGHGINARVDNMHIIVYKKNRPGNEAKSVPIIIIIWVDNNKAVMLHTV